MQRAKNRSQNSFAEPQNSNVMNPSSQLNRKNGKMTIN